MKGIDQGQGWVKGPGQMPGAETTTELILAACFEVSNEIGCGFLESVYHQALLIALRQKGPRVASQVALKVSFRGESVGEFFADILVNDRFILELKAVKALAPEHFAQLLNYLRASGLEAGFLLNFGAPKLEYRRLNNLFGKI